MLNAKNINGVFIKFLSLLLPGVSHKSIIKFYIPEIWKTSAFKHKVRIIAHRLTANHTKSHFVMSLCNTPEVRSAIKGKLMMEQAKKHVIRKKVCNHFRWKCCFFPQNICLHLSLHRQRADQTNIDRAERDGRSDWKEVWVNGELLEKCRKKKNVEEDGERRNVFQMPAVGDGNAEKAKVGVWAGWERWDFDFMLITSKDSL